MKPTILKIAASTMVLGTTLVGIAPTAWSTDVSAEDSRNAHAAAEYAGEAREALAASRSDRAIRFAERAVERMPRSAEYRHLLGRAYLAAGRFASAETSFQDALTIDPDLQRTAFNLALSQIAQGQNGAALEELRDLDGRMNASDLGLAFALAGDRAHAIEMLRDAARANGGDPRARQNLALAYAMDGRWAEARITASQDVSLAVLDQRMRDWAQFAQPQNSWDQVAGLLGVQSDGRDPGQPMRLALVPSQPQVMVAETAPVQEPQAEAVVAFTAPVVEDESVTDVPESAPITEIDVPAPADVADVPVEVAAEPVDVAAMTPVSTPAAAAPASAPVAVEPRVVGANAPVREVEFIVEDEAPVEIAASNVSPAPSAAAVTPRAPVVAERPAPAAETAPVRVAASTPVAPRPAEPEAPAQEPVAPATPERRAGRYYVQLGAFAIESNVDVAWERAVRRYSALSRFSPSRARYNNGRELYRLSFGGFESRREAADMCRTLRRHSVDCFVRARAGDSPFRMAARSGTGIAALR